MLEPTLAAAEAPPPRPLWRALLNRRNLIGLAGGLTSGALLGLGVRGTVVAALAVRTVWGRAEQTVPFTRRRHVVLLPGFAEAALGEHTYLQFLSDAASKGRLLDKDHRDAKLVGDIAARIVAALSTGAGGGHRRHLAHFKWQVAVVDEATQNAFCCPGGFIVVYTGLLDLLGRDADLVAMVMAHEVAHAVARHSAEKMGLGLAVSVGSALLLNAAGAEDSNGGGGNAAALERERARRAFGRSYSRAVRGGGNGGGDSDDDKQHLPYGAAAAAAPRHAPPPPPPPPPALPPWLSEQMIATFSSLLLELPFSRRSEAEADLIGLKLMALAGYKASKGPDAFKRLAAAGGGAPRARHRGAAAGADLLISQLGCTHPDSTRRAEMLERELAWMAQQAAARGAGAAAGIDDVGVKPDYFAL